MSRKRTNINNCRKYERTVLKETEDTLKWMTEETGIRFGKLKRIKSSPHGFTVKILNMPFELDLYTSLQYTQFCYCGGVEFITRFGHLWETGYFNKRKVAHCGHIENTVELLKLIFKDYYLDPKEPYI